MKKLLTRLLLSPKAFYERAGIQFDKLKAILETKLLMQGRIPLELIGSTKKQKPRTGRWAGLLGFIFSLFFGLTLIFPLISDIQWILSLVLFFSIYMLILAAILISTQTNVLLDTKDNQIILPKPVNGRTVLAARLLQMVISILDNAIPISLPALITMGVVKGWIAVLITLLLLPFAILFTVFILNLFYLALMRFTTVNQFKNFITYLQVLIAIIIYGGYQIVPRVLRKADLSSWNFPENTSTLFLPPYWMAAAWESLMPGGNHTQLRSIGTAMAFLIPLGMVFVMIKYLGPAFLQKINSLGTSASDEPTEKTNITNKPAKINQQPSWSQKLSQLFTKRGAERMAFEFTWLMTARSRDYKLKTYPTFGYLLIFIFLVLFRSNSKGISLHNPGSVAVQVMLISGIYLTIFIVMTMLDAGKYSDKRKAAWLYHIAPVKSPGAIITGFTKSILCKFAFPIIGFLSLAGLYFMGWKFIPNLLLAVGMILSYCFLFAYLSFREMPFSREELDNKKSTSFLINLFLGGLPLLMGVIHYFIFSMLPLVILLSVLSWLAFWMMYQSLYQRSFPGWQYHEEQEASV